MKKFLIFLKIFLLILFAKLDGAVKLKIFVNTNKIVVCERGYIQVKALNQDNTVDTNFNGMVEVISSSPYTVFINELEERDYTGKIRFFLTKGTNQWGDRTGKRGIGFWNYNPGYFTLKVSDIENKLISTSTQVYTFDFNSNWKILFSEIMFNTYDKKYEWIELYNNLNTPVNLSNFKFQRYSYNTYDGKGTQYEYTNKVSIIVKPKSFAIFCHGIDNLKTFFPDINTNNVTIIGDASIGFDLSSDNPLFLIDSQGNYCDGLIYNKSWGSSLKNISIERRDFNKPAYLKENWGECVSLKYWNYGVKGTPGAPNSISLKSPEDELYINISLNKKVFSPKNNESLEIRFSLSESAKVTIKVFNSDGNESLELIKHQDFGAGENIIRFYGKDRNNKILPSGLYILYFEVLNSEAGKTASKGVSFIISNKLE